MPRKPIDPTRATLEAVRERAARRRGKPYISSPTRGRPSKLAAVMYHHWAEVIAKYRDAGCPVLSCLPPRGQDDARDAIGKALLELEPELKKELLALENELLELKRRLAELEKALPELCGLAAREAAGCIMELERLEHNDEKRRLAVQNIADHLTRRKLLWVWAKIGSAFPPK